MRNMKNLKLLLYTVLVATVSLQSCFYNHHNDNDVPSQPHNSQYKAVILSREQLQSSIKMNAPKNMIKTGKIYVKDNFIFITDENKGFHIYDNTNPNAPQLTGFLEVPGATDMAIKNNTIYINQAVDLVAVSISSGAVTIHKRIENTFPQKISPDGWQHDAGANEIIVDWKS